MKAEMTEIVMSGDANHLGTCFGGKIMSWIDMVAAIAANRAVGTVVTASVDSIQFKKPIKVGDVVTLKACINEVWNSSMEVGVAIFVQSPIPCISRSSDFYKDDVIYTCLEEPKQACRAYLTFVAVDDKGNRRSVKDIVRYNPAFDKYTDIEIRRAQEANYRRKIRIENK
jgi:acyl-CoA hydrolase